MATKNTPKKQNYSSRFKSFGVLFTKFVAGAALRMNNVAEVQVYFGDLNDKSARGMNIASFPIDVGVFFESYRQKVIKSKTDLNVIDYFGLLKEQVEDIRALPYGFRKFYRPYRTKSLGDSEMVSESKAVAEETIKNFVTPSIGFSIESSIKDQRNPDGSISSDLLSNFENSAKALRAAGRNSNKIIKIYVFDRFNNKSPIDYLSAAGENSLSVTDDVLQIVDTVDVKLKRAVGLLNQFAKFRPARGGDVNDKKKYNVEFNSQRDFRDFVSSLVSVIKVGSNASMVTSCTVDTKIDKRLASSYMIKAAEGTKGPDLPLGAQVNNLPAYVIPGQVTINCVGCPLINYMQGFFVDFNTGTTLDNMYYVTNLNHTITPGKFTTSMKLSYNDISNAYRTPRELLDILNMTYTSTGEHA